VWGVGVGEGGVDCGAGGREGVHALSCLRIWLGIKAYTGIHGIRATRLRPGRHAIVVRTTARTKHDLPERVPYGTASH